MSPHKKPRRVNPHKPQRNLRNFVKFTAIAVAMIILIEFVIFKGERPYITKMKEEYYAKQAAEEQAMEDALPPVVVFPEDGEEYFEAPLPHELKDEQSMLPEKQFNITRLIDELKLADIEPAARPAKKPIIKKRTPRVASDGKTAKIAIVIDDIGMNLKQSNAAINLKAPITLAMLPYAKTVRDLAKKGKSKGHELIIHTPMEAISSDVSLGAMALRSGMSSKDLRKEFDKIAASFDGYVGINNHMGSKLTQDQDAMALVMGELKRRNLYFLDSKTIGSSIAADIAQKSGVPNAVRDVFLDHEDSPEFVLNALKKTEHTARKYGSAIAIGHPKANTMEALRKWIPTLKDKGFELVHLSELIYPKPDIEIRTASLSMTNIPVLPPKKPMRKSNKESKVASKEEETEDPFMNGYVEEDLAFNNVVEKEGTGPILGIEITKQKTRISYPVAY